MRSEKYVGLIAVRSGSKRIKNKNTRKFFNSSLLEIKIKQALFCDQIDEVVVSSDSIEMLELASSLGASIHKRDDVYCSDVAPMNDVYKHLAEQVSGDHIVYLHVTSPLLSDVSLRDSITAYKKAPSQYDSLATVESLKKYLWYNGEPINYDPQNHPRSQDLPNYYALNFAVNILPRELMILKKNIVGDKFCPFFLSAEESIDVDMLHDFQYAEWVYKNKNNDICKRFI